MREEIDWVLKQKLFDHVLESERLEGIDGKRMIPKCGWEMKKKSDVCTVSHCSARSVVNVQRD